MLKEAPPSKSYILSLGGASSVEVSCEREVRDDRGVPKECPPNLPNVEDRLRCGGDDRGCEVCC